MGTVSLQRMRGLSWKLNSFKNSLAKKLLRPEGQKYKQRRVGTAEAFRGGLGRT